jgi:hypothetical protein
MMRCSRLAAARTLAGMPQQHRLQFALRGPEWAFAIPDGDMAALEEVAAVCCSFWNGANSLLIPIGEKDAIPTDLDVFLDIRDIDQAFVHERVDEAARAQMADRFGHHRITSMWSQMTHHELHPLNLQPSFREPPAGGPHLALPIPVYDDEALTRLARVAWGRIDDEDRDEYAEAFLLEPHENEAAHFALIDGQVSGLAPLVQSAYLMGSYYQQSPLRARQVLIIDGDDFSDLVFFWNLRSRATTHQRPAVVAIPPAALRFPERLRSLREWTAEQDAIKPDLLVHAREQDRDAATAALAEAGFRHASDDWRLTEYWGEVPPERREGEFAFIGSGLVGGPMRRGIARQQLVMLESGRNSTSLEPPSAFRVRYWGGRVRFDLINWPLPFPPTRATAERVHMNAYVHQGVISLTTSASNAPYNFDFYLPGADETRGDFLVARHLQGELSAVGRYAQALIGRLGGATGLTALARQSSLDVLTPLTPLSRKKLLQRLEGKLRELYGESAPSRDELAAIIREHLIELEPQTAALDELASSTGSSQVDLLAALEPLIEAGFVRRGRRDRCRNCGYEDFYPLSELDERVQCHACQERFLLRVSAGPHEPRLAYQLDPLMARAMDQDLMPVLLTLRYLYSPAGAAAGAFWPGIEIIDETGAKQDCDVLLAQDGEVSVCECKKKASTLTLAQAERTIALAEKLGAKTIFSALEGDFADEINELAQRPDVRLVTREQLLPAANAP